MSVVIWKLNTIENPQHFYLGVIPWIDYLIDVYHYSLVVFITHRLHIDFFVYCASQRRLLKP